METTRRFTGRLYLADEEAGTDCTVPFTLAVDAIGDVRLLTPDGAPLVGLDIRSFLAFAIARLVRPAAVAVE